MSRRANRSGTLFNRNGIWYTKVKVGGRWDVKTTHTGDKDKARAILDRITKGCELTDRERLAAIKAKLEEPGPTPGFDEAWGNYIAAPENAGQSDGARATDRGRWLFLTRWLFGYDGGPRCRINRKAAHPEIERITDLTREIAIEFVTYAKTVSSPGTVNKYVRTFKRVWSFNGTERNPWDGFRKLPEDPNLRRALDDGEVEKLIREASGELRVLFALGAFTGLRMTDCARVRWEKFSPDGMTLTVRPVKTAHSSGCLVAIPVHPALAKVLGKRKRSGYVTPELAALSEWDLSDRVMDHFRACGFSEQVKPKGYRHAVAIVGFHSFRSTFITNMANIGAPMAMVQAIVGHMTPDMTAHYYRANAEAARSRIAALPAFGIV